MACRRFSSHGTSVTVTRPEEELHAAAAKDDAGNSAVMLCHYAHEKEVDPRQVQLNIPGGAERYEILCLDETHNGEKIGEYRPGDVLAVPNMCVLLLKSM